MTKQVSHHGYLVINDKGVFLHPADGKARPARKVAESIGVGALVTIEGTTNKFVGLRFFDRNREITDVTMAPSEFADFRRFKSLLLDHGYKFPTDPGIAQMLHSHLVELSPRERRHVLHRQGWHENQFVFAGEQVRLADRVLTFEPAYPEHARNFGKGGTLPDWKVGVANHGYHSTRLTLSISLGLAAALLKFSDVESGGIHLTGESGVGKTTCLLAAASVGGKAVRNSLFSWDTTRTGLEELAAAYNDNLLGLDEIERAPDTAGRAKELRDAAFKLAGGTGRIRSALYGAKTGKQPITWRLFFISTGETSLNEVARIDSMNRLRGEQVRAIDLPAEVHDKFGIFESLPAEYNTDSRKLAEDIEAACRQNYGMALREFVKCVARDSATISSDIEALMQMFFTGARVPEKGWEHRFAKRFALAYAAAKLAIKYNIVPWDAKMVARAIKACYLAARAAVPDADQWRTDGLARLRAQLRREESILDLKRSGHKVYWTREQAQAAQVFRRSGPEGVHFLVKTATFQSWFNSPLEASIVLDELVRRGCLIKSGRNSRAIQVEIFGVEGKVSYYAILETAISTS
jgi:putative DNA primase/helicase